MPRFFRLAPSLRVPLGLAALLACTAPAGAMLATNGRSLNGMVQTGAAASARIVSGPALAGLNGVAVEAAVVPDSALR